METLCEALCVAHWSGSLAFLRSPRFLHPSRPFPLCAVVRHVPGEMRHSYGHLGGLFLLSCRNCLDSARYTPGPQEHCLFRSLVSFLNSQGPPCHSHPLRFCQSSEAGTIKTDSTDLVMQMYANICKSPCKGGLPLWF